jgi:hypothetical protein
MIRSSLGQKSDNPLSPSIPSIDPYRANLRYRPSAVRENAGASRVQLATVADCFCIPHFPAPFSGPIFRAQFPGSIFGLNFRAQFSGPIFGPNFRGSPVRLPSGHEPARGKTSGRASRAACPACEPGWRGKPITDTDETSPREGIKAQVADPRPR